MADRSTDIAELVAKLDNENSTEREVLAGIAALAGTHTIETILASLPAGWHRRFTTWMSATRDNPALLGEMIANQIARSRIIAWSANAPANAAPAKPPLTAEDEALLAQMRANREKRMARYAEQGRPQPLPADSPIFEKWKDEPFQAPPPATPADGEDDLAWKLEQLRSEDPSARVYMLKAMAGNPHADAQVLAACERLLDDRTIALFGVPYSYGEIRWLAADAVAAIRGALGRNEPVVIDDVFAPISSGKVGQLADETGVAASTKGGVEGAIETLERIAAAGKLPRRRITREPHA